MKDGVQHSSLHLLFRKIISMLNIKKLSVLVILVACTNAVIAQKNRIDSIVAILQKIDVTKGVDTAKFTSLTRIIEETSLDDAAITALETAAEKLNLGDNISWNYQVRSSIMASLIITDKAKAIEYFKKAIEFEKVFPNVITQSTIKLSEIVIENNIVAEYKYVEEILMMKINSKSGLTFNNEKYIVYSILSIINNENGNKKIAKEYAEIAEQNANLESSGFAYHKKLGIVTKRNSVLDEKLNK